MLDPAIRAAGKVSRICGYTWTAAREAVVATLVDPRHKLPMAYARGRNRGAVGGHQRDHLPILNACGRRRIGIVIKRAAKRQGVCVCILWFIRRAIVALS